MSDVTKFGTVEFIERALMSAFDETGLGMSDRSRWLEDPGAWASERAGLTLWSKQVEIMEAVRSNKRVAVPSCHDTGKTFTAATTVGWWLDVHPPGTAFVVSTAPTAPQVKALLWREINRLHSSAGLTGRTNLTEWYINDELVAFGRKPSDYNESAFQGIHAPHVLVVLDEACGIPDNLWVAAEANTANSGSRILAIGNPDVNGGTFHRKCRAESGWKVIEIGYADTPAFTGEPVPKYVIDQLISPEWVEDMRVDWGEDSALFYSKVLGKFPNDDADPTKIIPSGMLTPCMYLDMEPGDVVEAGIDIGAGGDRTVIVERRGMKLGRIDTFRSADPMGSVGRIIELLNEWEVTRAKIDVIGVGWGLYGRLRETSAHHNPRGECLHGTEILPVNVAEAPMNPRRFLNRRAEIWWTVGRENSRNKLWDLGGLPDGAVAELTSARFEIMDSRGKIKVEPKSEIKLRLKRSPDIADALLLAFYKGGRADSMVAPTAGFNGVGNARGGSSPFAVSGGKSLFGRA